MKKMLTGIDVIADDFFPYPVPFVTQVQAIVYITRPAGLAVAEHGIKDIDEVPVSRFADLVFYQPVCINELVGHVPAAETGFEGNKIAGQPWKPGGGMHHQLLEEDKNFFGVPAIAQVIVAGIKNKPFRMVGLHHPFKKPDAGCQGRASEAQVHRPQVCKILVQACPQADG